METYFIRHTEVLDIDDRFRNLLWNERKIGVHFPWAKNNPKGNPKDSKSLDPNDYEISGKRAINGLCKLSREGGYVCAQYYSHDKYLIGKVHPKTKIKLIKGVWGNKNGFDNREAILKTLQLSKTIEIGPYQYAQIHIGRPRQGTISTWKSCGNLIKKLVEQKKVEFQIDDLQPSDLEVICSEYLRGNNKFNFPKLICLLAPIGRTMKDIDILGVAENGKTIFAQVTHLSFKKSTSKFVSLLKYSTSDSILIYFCSHDKVESKNGIFIVPKDQVISQYFKSKQGRMFLSKKKELLHQKRKEGDCSQI